MDVAVVGAGPAGSFCAWRLARAGHRVTILRSVAPAREAVRRRSDARRVRALPGARRAARGGAARVVGGAPARAARRDACCRSSWRRPIEIFSRRVLDSLLLERARKAGAELRPERVQRVRAERGAVELELGSASAFATSSSSARTARRAIVRRSLCRREARRPRELRDRGLPRPGPRRARRSYIEFTRDYAGYLWVFPRPDHASVGIAAPVGARTARSCRARVLELLERRYPGQPRPAARAVRREHSRRRRDRSRGPASRWSATPPRANDAITGEGIQHALDSGGARSPTRSTRPAPSARPRSTPSGGRPARAASSRPARVSRAGCTARARRPLGRARRPQPPRAPAHGRHADRRPALPRVVAADRLGRARRAPLISAACRRDRARRSSCP